MKLSSIVIARDEEKNIGRCIESQLECIDEIIVVIDERTCDRTLEIVKSYPQVKYKLTKWLGYDKTKQLAVSLAVNDWILWIDADEVITAKLCGEINEFKKNNPEYSAYSIPRLPNFLGRWIKHGGWYPGRVIRLFNKNNAVFSEKDVHEDLIINGTAGQLKNNLEHFTDPNIKHYFEKFNNYTSLAAEELNRKGKRFKVSDIILRPAFIFIKMYMLRLGFLDGIQGFILAVFSSAYVFTKYCKLWEIESNKNRLNFK